ncbi:MAG TPA: FtsK/SpoIIIE domain-containing protein [Anaerolineae bacterium]|nr:FtsK/SpoIIIE domain-containing protein [Anaerolineae bacterium]
MTTKRPFPPHNQPPSQLPPAIALMAGVAARLVSLKGEMATWWSEQTGVGGYDDGEGMDENVPVSLLDLLALLPPLPPLTAVLGWEEGERPLLLPLTSTDAHHVLIGGMTGAGKSTLLQTIIFSLAYLNRQAQLQLVLVEADSEAKQLQSLASLPHLLLPILHEGGEVLDLLTFLEEEKAYRQAQRAQTPAIVVVVDGLGQLLTTVGPSMLVAWQRLLAGAAEVGIYLVATVDEDTLAWQGLLPHFAARFVGRVSSSGTAAVMSGIPFLQANALLGGGDFLAAVAGSVYHFQAAAMTSYELNLCVQQVSRWARPVLLAQSRPQAPLPTVDEAANLGSGVYFVDERGAVPVTVVAEAEGFSGDEGLSGDDGLSEDEGATGGERPTGSGRPTPSGRPNRRQLKRVPERRTHNELPDVTYYEL